MQLSPLSPFFGVSSMTLCKGYIQMTLFPGTLVVLKLWIIIFSSNQTCLEHARAISYNLQKDLSNDALHAPINNLFTLAPREFVVGSQIPNLIPNLSFDPNSFFQI
jgi:hypothetical protein